MKSISIRLILSLTLIIGIFWLSAALISRAVFVEEIDEILAENLQGAAARILPIATHVLLSAPDSEPRVEAELPDDLLLLMKQRTDYLSFEVRDASGRIVLKSPGTNRFLSETRDRAGFYVTRDALLYALTDPVSHYSITIATASKHRDEAIAEATWALLLPMVGLMVLMAGTVFVLVRLFLSPIGALRKDLALRGSNNLHELDTQTMPRELQPIVASVNRLMRRLQQTMEAERVFAANSAHELRTPLAAALAQAQQLRTELGTDQGQARAAEIETSLKRLARLSTSLLQLARADANLGQEPVRQNLTPVLQAVVDEFAGQAGEPVEIAVDDRLHQDLMVQMDPDAFAITMRNLIENAQRHGTPGTPVRIVIGEDWTIRVINQGPVVPEADLPLLKQRFRRGRTNVEGAGLGLAITDKLIAQSGGILTLLSPARDSEDGFEAIVKLP